MSTQTALRGRFSMCCASRFVASSPFANHPGMADSDRRGSTGSPLSGAFCIQATAGLWAKYVLFSTSRNVTTSPSHAATYSGMSSVMSTAVRRARSPTVFMKRRGIPPGAPQKAQPMNNHAETGKGRDAVCPSQTHLEAGPAAATRHERCPEKSGALIQGQVGYKVACA